MATQYKYAIIKPSEDGESLYYLNNKEEQDINRLMEEFSITKWIEDYSDANYWSTGEAMLVKIQCINPVPVKVVTKWERHDG